MQTLITGTPGAGKTLLAISKLLLPMIGQTVKVTADDGTVTEYPRVIYTNIKGLLIEHELVEAGAAWEGNDRAGWTQAEGGNRKGWHNWHEWAKPGAILVVDEFQRVWPPRPNGAAVPPDISAMDTHRHMGVDFILITQNANNVDRHIIGLIGRHLHVRRVANMHAAIVYEWDHCSRSLLYSKAVSKGPWKYDKKVFRIYHSADAHTKVPRKVPTLVWVVLIAMGIAAWKIPESVARIAGKGEEHKLRFASETEKLGLKRSGSAASAPVVAGGGTQAHSPAVPVPVPGAADIPAAPVVAGCMTIRRLCRCYDTAGRVVDAVPVMCTAESELPRLESERPPAGRPAASNPGVDGAVLASMTGRRPLLPLMGE